MLLTPGSCKIQQNCTAYIKKWCKEGKILVDVCRSHHGHENQIQHIWLSKHKKEQIAAQLQQGITRDRILNDIRDEALKGEDLKRYHMTVAKDLANIKRSFGLFDVQKHSNDQDSVLAWIQEWQSS